MASALGSVGKREEEFKLQSSEGPLSVVSRLGVPAYVEIVFR